MLLTPFATFRRENLLLTEQCSALTHELDGEDGALLKEGHVRVGRREERVWHEARRLLEPPGAGLVEHLRGGGEGRMEGREHGVGPTLWGEGRLGTTLQRPMPRLPLPRVTMIEGGDCTISCSGAVCLRT